MEDRKATKRSCIRDPHREEQLSNKKHMLSFSEYRTSVAPKSMNSRVELRKFFESIKIILKFFKNFKEAFFWPEWLQKAILEVKYSIFDVA